MEGEGPRLVTEALAALGIERLLLTVHDASFPGEPDEDIGRGSPYSAGARAFYRFARGLGFGGIQLGPQGKTSLVNASPFDGTLFAHSPLSIALRPLGAQEEAGETGGLLAPDVLARLVAERPVGAAARVDQAYVWHAQEVALRAAFTTYLAAPRPQLKAEIAAFAREQASWLAADSLYEALARRHGTDDWKRWPRSEERSSPGTDRDGPGDLDRRLFCPLPGEADSAQARCAQLARSEADQIAFNEFCQYLLHTQHAELRATLSDLGMKLFGDLQIGVSHRDLWSHRPLFLVSYLMGAPPSRTNPDGQPWGYPVLDPRLTGAAPPPGDDGARPALEFFRTRVDKMLREFDGIRIDHPHGLVCPWVYRAGHPDPLRAVQTGARLFDSPDLAAHPALAAFAIPSREQLAPDANHPRYADDWVRSLRPAQVARYAVLFDELLAAAERHGRDRGDVASEVLSTCPFPLAQVLARHGLGRFRVTQKADPTNRHDAYRTAEASAADWVMVGTHDTPPIWRVMDGWQGTPRVGEWARYLAERLAPVAEARPGFAAALEGDRRQLATALFADLFVGPARRVSVFFADLFGLRDVYNAPGTVDPANWTLRVPPDYRRLYAQRVASGEACDLRAALAMALRARAGGIAGTLTELAAALERMPPV